MKVVGIGEVLWDVFPDGKQLGGAPLNFVYHCGQLGLPGIAVSCVGADALGEEIRALMVERGMDPSGISETHEAPTGTVQVIVNEAGHPSYEIQEGVAWDRIDLAPELLASAHEVDAVCFGTLAQRHEESRAAVHELLAALREDALRIFDVNLRQSFYSKEILEASLQSANVLKVSDEELPVLADLFGWTGSERDQLAACRKEFGLTVVAYTCGPEGSHLITQDGMESHPGLKVELADTVGAGDSFTAALCVGVLKDRPAAEVLAHANQVAAYVCSQPGATPVLPRTLVEM